MGSSPLTRGKQSEGTGAFTHHGLIPAHAGKTSRPRSRLAVPRAHPRSHWENDVSTASSRQSSGLSPLTEGKLLGCDRDCGQLRLTPAHAGKTARGRGRRRTQRAHPRTCGENMAMPRNVRSRTGSSPLTRGKHRDLRRIEREAGLIPTHAGKTAASRRRPRTSGAHPRSRRENPSMPGGTYVDEGSSPLTRGKPRGEGAPCVPEGLIPTHAGKTKARAGTWSVSRAHPRSRGENVDQFAATPVKMGSSPLTRGKRCMILPTGRPVRLIPTHARKTAGSFPE